MPSTRVFPQVRPRGRREPQKGAQLTQETSTQPQFEATDEQEVVSQETFLPSPTVTVSVRTPSVSKVWSDGWQITVFARDLGGSFDLVVTLAVPGYIQDEMPYIAQAVSGSLKLTGYFRRVERGKFRAQFHVPRRGWEVKAIPA